MVKRVIWSDKERLLFFKRLDYPRNKFKWSKIAAELKVHTRTLLSWRRGETRIPHIKLVRICTYFSVKLPEKILQIDEYSHLSSAGRKGAIVRMAKYGPPGTPDGRRKGGLRAIKIMRLSNHSFINERVVKIPRYSYELAEFIGIILGDGTVTRYQVSVCGSETTDGKYKFHVQKLGKKLFNLIGAISLRKNQDCWVVTFSSIQLVRYLNSQGLACGSKAKYQAAFPAWIKSNNSFALSCVRGLFDTDGSVYLDHHKINGKVYMNIGACITSYIPTLLESALGTLKNNSLSPTISSHRNILIRKSYDVERFFSIVKPSNFKHLNRYEEFKLQRSNAGFD